MNLFTLFPRALFFINFLALHRGSCIHHIATMWWWEWRIART